MNRHVGHISVTRMLCSVLAFLVFMTGTMGCEPLRKKFVRKKKERTSAVVPVLEPVEYPPEQYSADSLYRQRYSLWKVWFKDLTVAMSEGDSAKRVLHILDQLTLQLRALQPLVVESKRERLDHFLGGLNGIKGEYEKPEPLRHDVILRNKARSLDRAFRAEFSPQRMSEALTSGMDGE